MNRLTTQAPRQAGKGKFEFLILVALIGILGNILLERLMGIEREIERTEVELTLRNMETGLQLAIGERLMEGREDRLAELLNANPIDFLGHPPRGYTQDAGQAAKAGSWHFDPASHVLTYRPRQSVAFAGQRQLRWKMTHRNGPGGRIAGMRLERLPN